MRPVLQSRENDDGVAGPINEEPFMKSVLPDGPRQNGRVTVPFPSTTTNS